MTAIGKPVTSHNTTADNLRGVSYQGFTYYVSTIHPTVHQCSRVSISAPRSLMRGRGEVRSSSWRHGRLSTPSRQLVYILLLNCRTCLLVYDGGVAVQVVRSVALHDHHVLHRILIRKYFKLKLCIVPCRDSVSEEK